MVPTARLRRTTPKREGKTRSIAFNLALLLAVLFPVFTAAGNTLAGDTFSYAHENLTAYLTRVFEKAL